MPGPNFNSISFNFYFYKMLHGLKVAQVTLFGQPLIHFVFQNYLFSFILLVAVVGAVGGCGTLINIFSGLV